MDERDKLYERMREAEQAVYDSRARNASQEERDEALVDLDQARQAYIHRDDIERDDEPEPNEWRRGQDNWERHYWRNS